jgi:hypothetical protein
MLSREQLGDAANCGNLRCEDCKLKHLAGNCMPPVAKTTLELLNKLERAKEVMHDLECCSTCVNHKYTGKEPCISCLKSTERSPYWSFNEKLLEGGQSNE